MSERAMSIDDARRQLKVFKDKLKVTDEHSIDAVERQYHVWLTFQIGRYEEAIAEFEVTN